MKSIIILLFCCLACGTCAIKERKGVNPSADFNVSTKLVCPMLKNEIRICNINSKDICVCANTYLHQFDADQIHEKACNNNPFESTLIIKMSVKFLMYFDNLEILETQLLFHLGDSHANKIFKELAKIATIVRIVSVRCASDNVTDVFLAFNMNNQSDITKHTYKEKLTKTGFNVSNFLTKPWLIGVKFVDKNWVPGIDEIMSLEYDTTIETEVDEAPFELTATEQMLIYVTVLALVMFVVTKLCVDWFPGK